MLTNLLKKANRPGKSGGFTLIELIIVMAIAGLIFVIVFLAVGGAQRSRRDTQRKSDAARLLAAMEQYAANHEGVYASGSAEVNDKVIADYLTNGATNAFNDPEKGEVYVAQDAEPTQAGEIWAASEAYCDNGELSSGGKKGQVAVEVYQENGGSYCVDNK